MLEYFIATPGARKGLVDTALRTADSGYLTRRLVDVAQELIINDEDPFAERRQPVRGIWIEDVEPDQPGKRHLPRDPALQPRSWPTTSRCPTARCCAKGSTVARGRDGRRSATIRASTRVRVLSPLTDDSDVGISAASYGLSLATGKTIEIGEAVGVIAAQSIGEPGTQLTMRTFHTGGIAGAATSPAVCPAWSSSSRPAARRARPPSPGCRASSASPRTRARAGSSPSSPTTAPRRPTRCPASPASRSPTARRSTPATPSSTAPAIPRSCSRSRASARPSSTSSTRSRRCTATRACRSTTSTSS